MTLLEIEPASVAGVVVARFDGDVDLASVPAITTRIVDAVANDVVGLVVDLRTVRYLDSAGVHMLFEIARLLRISRQGLAIALDDGSPLWTLVRVTNLHEAAPIRPTPEQCATMLAADPLPEY